MRMFLVGLLISALASGLACEGADTDEEAEETMPEDTTVTEMAPPPPPSPSVEGTVEEGQAFDLAWPNEQGARACISIPADAVQAGTVVTISQRIGIPEGVEDAAHNQGLEVFPPVYQFSSDPDFAIADTSDEYTIGICSRHRHQNGDQHGDESGYRIARFPGDGSLETLRSADPCSLSCTRTMGTTARTGPGSLLEGTPLDPAPLQASAESQAGIGGKGASLSDFATVAP